MLQLKNIVKDYNVGDSSVRALRGVSLTFRDNEFVSILGPSGCGKTTMLNIIGGLDRYTSGDLIINGRSTTQYSAADWDTYRNHSIGFVFQNYNLITHQTVLANVELALTLSGVSRAERRRRAIQALEKVGLGDQLKKKPNQMSGGQMQRVAIARALVNDPDILLADEPTGALDSETSVQIMDILREISADKLIIMVTHNRELAEQYSTRIVSLLDGTVIDDTAPCSGKEAEQITEKSLAAAKRDSKKGRRSMGFFTALSLSFNNLMTKRTRTLLTSFAGSIGIIGIALILALSTGVQKYINDVQRDTLSSYPITIESEQQDLNSLISAFGKQGGKSEDDNSDSQRVYSDSRMYELFNAVFSAETVQNDLESFKEYLDDQMVSEEEDGLYNHVTSIQYNYKLPMSTYVEYEDGWRSTDMTSMFSQMGDSDSMYASMSSSFSTMTVWQQLLPGKNGEPVSDLIFDQYDLVYGRWPEKANEIVMVVSKNNEVSDLAFYALGEVSDEEITDILSAVMKQESFEVSERSLDYSEICSSSFRMLLTPELYADSDGDGIWSEVDDGVRDIMLKNAYELNIVGIIRPNDNASSTALTGVFAYTNLLTEYISEQVQQSEALVEQQKPENENRDILTGLPFELDSNDELDNSGKAEKVKEYFASLNDAGKRELYTEIVSTPSEEYVAEALEQYMSNYDTREKMEDLVSSSYALSSDQTSEYLSGYSDDELKELISEQLVNVIKNQYAAEAQGQVDAIVQTPDEDELAGLTAQVISQLDSTEKQIGYVMTDWQQSTTMSTEAITSYLMRLTPEQLGETVKSVAEKTATEIYAGMVDMDSPESDAKVAAVFDAQYGSETDTEVLAEYYDSYMPSSVSGATLESNLAKLGQMELSAPSSISIYAATFEDKDDISNMISEYNESVDEDSQITYTDYIALMMSGVKSIINAISYGLIAFVAISLVVSSIMIGIITYISVLERTKEIGILRSIGASRHDVSMVFNAETFIVGLISGLLGIGISLLLCIPISLIIHSLSGITAISAVLEPSACVILVLISMTLTVIAGFIPSGLAARKDPVEALRTE